MGFAAVCFGVRVNGQSCVVADSEMAFFSPFVEEFVSFLGLRGIGSVVSWLDGGYVGKQDFCEVSGNWISGKLMCRMGCSELAICSQSANWISARLKQGNGYGSIPRWNRKLTHKGN